MSTAERLASCPFCGSADAKPVEVWKGRWQVYCNFFFQGAYCEASGPERLSQDQAIAAWNRRTPADGGGQGVTPPERNEKLLALADRIDHERLWARAGLERSGWTQEQHDRCDAGVELRRYAALLGQNCWRIFPPRPTFSFSASTLEAVVEMARKDEQRRIGTPASTGGEHV